MKARKRRFGVILAVSLCVVVLGVAAFYNYCAKEGKSERKLSEARMEKRVHTRMKGDATQKETSPELGRKVSIIIDDIGYDLSIVEALLSLKAPLTFAILPQCPYSKASAELIHRAGNEILLHLPMEPHNNTTTHPGHNALFVDMSESEIKRQLEVNLDSVPYVIGVSNHMGSKFMEKESQVSIVLVELKKRGLFFVDSKTTSLSKGLDAARKVGVVCLTRTFFLDNEREEVKVILNISRYLNDTRSRNQRSMIFIGHPYPETVAALKKIIPYLKSKGCEIVPISHLVDHS